MSGWVDEWSIWRISQQSLASQSTAAPVYAGCATQGSSRSNSDAFSICYTLTNLLCGQAQQQADLARQADALRQSQQAQQAQQAQDMTRLREQLNASQKAVDEQKAAAQKLEQVT